ncbi:MAG: rhodanese-like domain-containing protein [Longimicrobiales bacterium]
MVRPGTVFFVLVLLLNLHGSTAAAAQGGAAVAGAEGAKQREAPLTVQKMVAEANAMVQTLAPADAIRLLGNDAVTFVDLRTETERATFGRVPGDAHVPRGMLEFFIDSPRPERRQIFHSGRRIIFYCTGGSRSALAARTAMQMGLDHVAHVGGGFRAWIEAGGPLAPAPTPSRH